MTAHRSRLQFPARLCVRHEHSGVIENKGVIEMEERERGRERDGERERERDPTLGAAYTHFFSLCGLSHSIFTRKDGVVKSPQFPNLQEGLHEL